MRAEGHVCGVQGAARCSRCSWTWQLNISDQASRTVTLQRCGNAWGGPKKIHGVKLTHTHAFAGEAAPSSRAVWKLRCQVSPGYLQHTSARAVSAGPHKHFFWHAANWQAASTPHQGSSCVCQRHVRKSRHKPTPSVLGAPARECAAVLRANKQGSIESVCKFGESTLLVPQVLDPIAPLTRETEYTAQAQQYMRWKTLCKSHDQANT